MIKFGIFVVGNIKKYVKIQQGSKLHNIMWIAQDNGYIFPLKYTFSNVNDLKVLS